MSFFTGGGSKLKTFSTIADWQKELGASLASSLGGITPSILSRLFEREDYESIVSDFTKTFATPVMKMWQRDIAPMVAEGFNAFPGSFYSKSRFTGMQREAEEFLSGKISPLLFSALEGARGRELSRQQLIANVLGVSTQLSTAPTISGSVVQNAPSTFSQIMDPLSSGLGDIVSVHDYLYNLS